jgi:hypothetical protein
MSADEPGCCLDDVRSVPRVRAPKGDFSDDNGSGHRYADEDESSPRERVRLNRLVLHDGLLTLRATELETRRTQFGHLWAND